MTEKKLATIKRMHKLHDITKGVHKYPKELMLLNTKHGFIDKYKEMVIANPTIRRQEIFDQLNDFVFEWFGQERSVNYNSFGYMLRKDNEREILENGMESVILFDNAYWA